MPLISAGALRGTSTSCCPFGNAKPAQSLSVVFDHPKILDVLEQILSAPAPLIRLTGKNHPHADVYALALLLEGWLTAHGVQVATCIQGLSKEPSVACEALAAFRNGTVSPTDGQCLLAENMGLSIDAWAAGVQSALAVWQEMLPIPVSLNLPADRPEKKAKVVFLTDW